jgi:hypothetical protein
VIKRWNEWMDDTYTEEYERRRRAASSAPE